MSKRTPIRVRFFVHSQNSCCLVLPSASISGPSASISVHQRSCSAVRLCGLLLGELGALARNPLFGGSDWCRGSLSLTQRRKDAKGKSRDLSQGLLQAKSTTGSLVLPSAFHQRPSAVRFCGLLLGGSGCRPTQANAEWTNKSSLLPSRTATILQRVPLTNCNTDSTHTVSCSDFSFASPS